MNIFTAEYTDLVGPSSLALFVYLMETHSIYNAHKITVQLNNKAQAWHSLTVTHRHKNRPTKMNVTR